MPQTMLGLRSPTGDRMTLQLPDGALVTSVAASVRLVGGAYSRAFQIGPRGYHEVARQHLLAANPSDRFVSAGREVVMATTPDQSTTIVTLLDRYHELMTVFTGPAPNRATLIGLFETIDINDHPDGMRVVPHRSTAASVSAQQFAVDVKDRGMVGIPGPESTRSIVPRHRGASTPKGELWRRPLHEDANLNNLDDFMFVVAGPKGAAEVQLYSDSPMDNSALIDWAGGLSVTWQAA